MAGPARFQTFFQQQAQGFMHGVDEVAGGGVVVAVIAVPVVVELEQVEVIALYRLAALLDDLDGSRVQGDGARPGRAPRFFWLPE